MLESFKEEQTLYGNKVLEHVRAQGPQTKDDILQFIGRHTGSKNPDELFRNLATIRHGNQGRLGEVGYSLLVPVGGQGKYDILPAFKKLLSDV